MIRITRLITLLGLITSAALAGGREARAQGPAPAPALLQSSTTVVPGTPAITLSGAVAGDDLKTNVFGARKGQPVRLELKSARATWLVMRLFPVATPEGADVLNNYISSETSLTGPIPADGDYVVQVGLRRVEARRGGKAAYEIALAVQANRTATLEGTNWQLLRIQSMNDQTVTPDDRSKYTMSFESDGALNVRADCNRGRTSWKASTAGELSFGPVALTRAICPPPSLHDRFVRDLPYVRSYMLKGGHLFLSLMADGGIYEFEPIPNGASRRDQATAHRPSFDCAKALRCKRSK